MGRAGNSFRLGRPRNRPTPSETYVYHALEDGRSEDEIAYSLGISRKVLTNFVKIRLERWRVNPPGRLVDDERRIVITRETYLGHAYRTVTVSLPRISMHVLARAEARHG